MAAPQSPSPNSPSQQHVWDQTGSLDVRSPMGRLRLHAWLLSRLNRTVQVAGSLSSLLEDLLPMLGLESGWIVMEDDDAQDPLAGPGFAMVAHVNLPPAMGLDHHGVWEGRCTCEKRQQSEGMERAHNETACSRVGRLCRERACHSVHATAPVRTGSEVIGLLNVANAGWTPLDADLLLVLEDVGRSLGEALARGQAYRTLEAQRLEELAVLTELSRGLLTSGGVDALLRRILDRARAALDVDAAALLLADRSKRTLRFRGAVGWRRNPALAGRTLPVQRVDGHVGETAHPHRGPARRARERPPAALDRSRRDAGPRGGPVVAR